MSEVSVFNPLQLSEDEFAQIENLSATNYGPRDIAIYLSLDVKLFLEQFYLPDSKVKYHYERGILVSSFEIDNKLLENAKGGNITATQESKKATEKRIFENHKNRILNEG